MHSMFQVIGGKANWGELGIVGRYWLSQEGPLYTIVVEDRMCSSHPAIYKTKLLFAEWNCFSLAGIVARYRWYVCSRRIQLWAEFSDCPLTDSYVPPPPIPPSELLCSAHVSLRCMGNLEEFEEILQFLYNWLFGQDGFVCVEALTFICDWGKLAKEKAVLWRDSGGGIDCRSKAYLHLFCINKQENFDE